MTLISSFTRIIRIRETGLLKRIKDKFLSKKAICEGDAREFAVVGFSDVKPIIIIFVSGVFLSLALLLFEIYLTRNAHFYRNFERFPAK